MSTEGISPAARSDSALCRPGNCRKFCTAISPSCRATVDTSMEWVSRVRTKSLWSRGNTWVLS